MLAVGEVDVALGAVDGHFENIVVIVELDVRDDQAALFGRGLHHLIKKLFFHRSK